MSGRGGRKNGKLAGIGENERTGKVLRTNIKTGGNEYAGHM